MLEYFHAQLAKTSLGQGDRESTTTYTLDRYVLPFRRATGVIGACSRLYQKLIICYCNRYLGLQNAVEAHQPGASFNNGIVGTSAFTIPVGAHTATVSARHPLAATINSDQNANSRCPARVPWSSFSFGQCSPRPWSSMD